MARYTMRSASQHRAPPRATSTQPARRADLRLGLAQALKSYGMLLADNGSPWYISGAPDRHRNNSALHLLDGLTGRDFQVVNTSSLPHPGR